MRGITCILLWVIAGSAWAGDYVISGSVGQASVDVSDYNEPDSYAVELQYNFSAPVGIALGRRFFDDFKIKGVSSGYLELTAWELALVGNFVLNERFSLHPRLGYLSYDLTAYSMGGKVGEDSDGSLTLGVDVRFRLVPNLSLMAGLGRAQDVSDSTIQWMMGGVAIDF